MIDVPILIMVDEDDYITCTGCRVTIGKGRACGCPLRTVGPGSENSIRKRIVEDDNGDQT